MILLSKAFVSIFFFVFFLLIGQMNEALRQALSQELGFSGRIDVEGTEYFE